MKHPHKESNRCSKISTKLTPSLISENRRVLDKKICVSLEKRINLFIYLFNSERCNKIVQKRRNNGICLRHIPRFQIGEWTTQNPVLDWVIFLFALNFFVLFFIIFNII